MPVKEGDKVKVEYTGLFEDGTVFDSSEKHGQPLDFEVGKKMVVPGFEKAIVGMEKGEEKEVTLKPEEAYGEINPEHTKEIPKDQLPEGQEPKAGMMIGVGLPTGQQIPAKIIKVTEKSITIDLNHPLAGKVLKFKLKVVDF